MTAEGARPRALADALAEVYGAITHVTSRLSARDFLRPTRAQAWCARDLLFHLLLDAQRALVSLATPSIDEADVDSATYWSGFGSDDGDADADHARFVRLSSAAYRSPDGLVAQWRATSEAAVVAARGAPCDGRVATQGHVLGVPDFLSTLVVEATVHYLDLTLDLTALPPPPGAVLETRRVLDAILEAQPPTRWDDVEYLLKATGRLGLTDRDGEELGSRADRLPLLG